MEENPLERITLSIEMSTPWGRSQHVVEEAPGVRWVSTSSHGGFWLDATRRKEMPKALSLGGPWYEEDCDWSRVVVGLPHVFGFGDTYATAQKILRNWFPEAYEAHFGCVLKPGLSMKKDDAKFDADHAQDWLAICAYGDWHEDVPAGMVGVVATKGGIRNVGNPEGDETQYYLISVKRYQSRGKAYVVQPDDKEWLAHIPPRNSKRVA